MKILHIAYCILNMALGQFIEIGQNFRVNDKSGEMANAAKE